MVLSLADYHFLSNNSIGGEVLLPGQPSTTADQQWRWLWIEEFQVGQFRDSILTFLEVSLEVIAVRGLPAFPARTVDHKFHFIGDPDGRGCSGIEDFPRIVKVEYPILA